ncbi:hypothetical protein QM797_02100 [Rhodococcus sp. IEGM 1381]|uniref:hypothetical protein n=1 Tax=Rhodococcus sp. IEGM 1381 TaxID=3047085 RepID=UPI0024B69A41|nr:hypothetical protein [Rhodococcus sp. IEGM 1381]MDI9893505.1 hypothetical protein [Rhodococcus sp. IEGM 1381]
MQDCDDGNSGRFENSTSVLVETGIYGELDLIYRDDEICGSFREGVPMTVTISRTGPRTSDTAPIGTRTAAHLQASIDGRDIVLDPGRARLFKRSYRIGIQYGGRTLTLRAKNLEDSVLLDGSSDRGDNEFGVLTRVFAGGVDVLWSLPFTMVNKTIEPPTPSREDALVGIVVAAAFGTGGLSLTTIVMGALESILP